MKTTMFCLLACIIIVITSVNVMALGIGGDTLIRDFFKPDTDYNFVYTLYADPGSDNYYQIYPQKDLSEYVVFDTDSTMFIEAGGTATISGRIEFPSEIETPGWQTLMICAEEDCKRPGMVCAKGSVCAMLSFMVLYPGTYPQISFGAPNVNVGEPVEFTVGINNLGNNDINTVTGKVDVFDLKSNSVGSVQLDSTSIKSMETGQIKGTMDTEGILPGNFTAHATISADGVERKANASFRIGTLDVKILNHTKEMEIGGIKRFTTSIESVWNDPLKLYGEVSIYGNKGALKKVKTAEIVLDPWQKADIEAFIDTSNLEEKEYDIKVEVFYAEKSSFVDGKLDMKMPPAPPITAIEEGPAKGLSTTALTIMLVIVVIILTVVNIFLSVYKRKKED